MTSLRVEPDDWPLVAPGRYEVAYVSHRTRIMFGSAPKLEMLFRVQDPGEFNGVVLPRWYNLKKARGPRSFTVAKRCDLMCDIAELFSNRLPKRLDRVSLEPFMNAILVADVATVKTNSRQREVPEVLRYSKINRFVSVSGP